MDQPAPLYNSRVTKIYIQYLQKYYPDIAVDSVLSTLSFRVITLVRAVPRLLASNLGIRIETVCGLKALWWKCTLVGTATEDRDLLL